MEAIYLGHRTGSVSFNGTLLLLRDLLGSRLNPDWRSINVQGCNSGGKVTLVFTIFEEGNHLPHHYNGHTMVFHRVKNFRQYRPDGDISNEMRLMSDFISSLAGGPLSGYLR
jgi:hypothetical protein